MVTVVLIVLVVAMMVGPVMMLRPSPRQTRIAKLRNLAAQKGVRVRMASLQKNTQSESKVYAVYSIPWPEHILKPHRNKLDWSLMYTDMAHELNVNDHWEWCKKNDLSQAVLAELSQRVKDIPVGIKYIAATAGGFEVSWNEVLAPDETAEQAIKKIQDFLEHTISKLGDAYSL